MGGGRGRPPNCSSSLLSGPRLEDGLEDDLARFFGFDNVDVASKSCFDSLSCWIRFSVTCLLRGLASVTCLLCGLNLSVLDDDDDIGNVTIDFFSLAAAKGLAGGSESLP